MCPLSCSKRRPEQGRLGMRKHRNLKHWLKCDSTRLWLTKLRLRGNTMTYRTPFQVFRDLDVKGTPVTCIPDWETTCNVNWFPGTRDV